MIAVESVVHLIKTNYAGITSSKDLTREDYKYCFSKECEGNSTLLRDKTGMRLETPAGIVLLVLYCTCTLL